VCCTQVLAHHLLHTTRQTKRTQQAAAACNTHAPCSTYPDAQTAIDRDKTTGCHARHTQQRQHCTTFTSRMHWPVQIVAPRQRNCQSCNAAASSRAVGTRMHSSFIKRRETDTCCLMNQQTPATQHQATHVPNSVEAASCAQLLLPM
jgi:hypothetical protein